VAIAIQDSSYVAYNSLVILQPLLKPIETMSSNCVIRTAERTYAQKPVISRFYTQGCEDEKVFFPPGILQEDEVTKL
jgi:hypothetical protein